MQLAIDAESLTDPPAAGKAPLEPSVAPATRKIGIRLTERVFELLEAATERPGVGKSMIVAAALERYFGEAPPVEDILYEQSEALNARFDRLERLVLTLSETVALHARYHFSVMPPLPESEQREACLLGDQRFRVLAEQVDRRVRLGRPLIEETIDRLYASDSAAFEQNAGPTCPSASVVEPGRQGETPEIQQVPSAAAGEGGSNQHFRQLPNSFLRPA